MPPEKQVNKDFLKAVFRNQKRLLKKNQVNYVSVPGYNELAVKRLWPDLSKDEAFTVYFQDKFADEKVPNRDYFFNILNSLYPEYLDNVMKHACKLRYTAEGEDGKPDAIQATDEWMEQLQMLPYKSCKHSIQLLLIHIHNIEKNGKTLYLLKQKSKATKPKKKRKIIPLLGSI